MFKNILLSTLFFSFTNLGISQNKSIPETLPFLKDYNSYWYYYNDNTNLSNDFIPLNESKKEIEKLNFLKQLLKGKFVPIKVLVNNKLCYQLYKINSKISDDIKDVVKQMAEIEIKNLMFEGKKIPNFNFMDLDGKKYNYNNTTGKIIVLKLWFINCQTCIQEMPQLNGLVKKYSDRNDVLFLSLAFDNSKKLKKFLSKTTFKYAVVANKEKYILETLQVNEFPTHIVLNKKGIIVKVLTSARLLPEILSKILI
jgi:peroxiredoxin